MQKYLVVYLFILLYILCMYLFIYWLIEYGISYFVEFFFIFFAKCMHCRASYGRLNLKWDARGCELEINREEKTCWNCFLVLLEESTSVKPITVYCTWGWRSVSCDSWRSVCVFKQFHMVQRRLNNALGLNETQSERAFTWWRETKSLHCSLNSQFTVIISEYSIDKELSRLN